MSPERTQASHLNVRQKALTPGIAGPMRIAFAVAFLVLVIKPSFGQQMDPVRGPLELQAPGPFFEGSKGGGAYGNSTKSDFGRVRSWTFTDGETLKGKCDWVTASSASATAAAPGPTTPDTNSPQQNLAAAWDLVNGPGYYAAHVAGSKILRGTFTGDKGTVLQVESLDNYVAVGEDNRGNLYKIVW
jgi:hypothetical protein